MKKIIILFVFGTLIISCNKEKFFDGPDFFEDDFENYSALEDLLSDEDENWSFTQLTNENNIILVDTSKFHSGNRSLKFIAARSTNELLSKCTIAKQRCDRVAQGVIDAATEMHVHVPIVVRLEGTNALDWLFLFDLEEQTAIGAGPGMRLALVNNQLLVEYKFYESSILQPIGQEIDFPRNEWVEIVWEVKLSQKNEGTVKLWQNGILIIDTKNNRTLPKDLLYSQQGTKGMYSSVEIGITANSKDNDLTIWVDDILFKKVE